MEEIILQKARQMVARVREKVLGEGFSVEKCIPELMKITNETALDVYKVLIEQADQAIREAKKERKEQGLIVERVGDTRKIVTSMGELTYNRSYYQNKETGQFEYPVDHLMGIDVYERVDPGLAKGLVACARTQSYRKSSKSKCDGALSAQTVMNKIRKSEPEIKPVEKCKVAVLHIDADEDHVAVQHGKRKKSTEVPLVSVYEGIEKIGQRGVCKNIFHISEYGKKPDELWEEVLSRIEERYDLEGTRIYLHGDGAGWIKAGLEWLPNSVFVLDSYHKNKYIMALTAGCSDDEKKMLRRALKQAMEEEDADYFQKTIQYVLDHYPERTEDIQAAADYLLSHIKGVSIRKQEPEAKNGGATEPHISHVLSSRLSSRPKGWSKATLEHFVPILAAGDDVKLIRRSTSKSLSPVEEKVVSKAKRKSSSGIRSEVKPLFLQRGKQDSWYDLFHGILYEAAQVPLQ